MFRLVLALALASAAAAAPGDLPRRASLGLRLSPAPAGGATIDEVLAGQSGSRLGVAKGDRLLSAGGNAMRGPAEVVAYAGTLVAGSPVDLEVERAGKRLRLKGKALGRPMESYEGAKTVYGSVEFRGGGFATSWSRPPRPAPATPSCS
jgi:S1-C subfamily serine protease